MKLSNIIRAFHLHLQNRSCCPFFFFFLKFWVWTGVVHSPVVSHSVGSDVICVRNIASLKHFHTIGPSVQCCAFAAVHVSIWCLSLPLPNFHIYLKLHL